MVETRLYNGDCLDILPSIPDGAVDMVLCDLPYGVTACHWDSIVPLEPLWKEYTRVIRDDGCIVLFATQPFTSVLISSRTDLYRYSWIWRKNQGSNFQLANIQPLRVTEDICVFSKAKSANGAKPIARYFPILETRDKPTRNGGGLNTVNLLHRNTMKQLHKVYTDRRPRNVLEYSRVYGDEKVHPTQKPVALCEYLIKTYTKEGETVLDNTMGSGTTGVACVRTGRSFIGIEKEEKYFEIAKQRIENERNKPQQQDLFN